MALCLLSGEDYGQSVYVNEFIYCTICWILIKNREYRDIHTAKIFSFTYKIPLIVAHFQAFIYVLYKINKKLSEYSFSDFQELYLAILVGIIFYMIIKPTPLCSLLPLNIEEDLKLNVDDLIFKLEEMSYFLFASKRSEYYKGLIEGVNEVKRWGGSNRYQRIFNSSNTKNGSNNESFENSVRCYLAFLYNRAIKEYPDSLDLRLSFIQFMFEVMQNKEEGYAQINAIAENSNLISTYYNEIIQMKLLLEAEKMRVDAQNTSFMNQYLTSQLNVEHLKRSKEIIECIDSSAQYILQLWQFLEEDSIKLEILRVKLLRAIEESNSLEAKLFEYKQQLERNPALMIRYSNYLLLVMNRERQSDKHKEKANLELKFLKDREGGLIQIKDSKENISKVSSGVVILRIIYLQGGNGEIELNIHRCNTSFSAMLGFSRKDMLESDTLSKVLPEDWLNILKRLIKEQQGDLNYANQTLYLKCYTGNLRKFTVSIRRLPEEYIVMLFIPVFNIPEIPEIIYRKSDGIMIGHNSCLMKYFDLECFDLSEVGIVNIAQIIKNKREKNGKGRRVSISNELRTPIRSMAEICDKAEPENTQEIASLYAHLSEKLHIKTKQTLLDLIPTLKVDKIPLTFCDLDKDLNLIRLSFSRYIKTSNEESRRIKKISTKQPSFSFSFNIDDMEWLGKASGRIQTSHGMIDSIRKSFVYESIKLKEQHQISSLNAMQNLKKCYNEGIRIMRLRDGKIVSYS